MHVPWVQTPGVRHSFTSVGEKSKLASYPLHSLQHQAESVSIKRPGTSILRGPSTLGRTRGHSCSWTHLPWLGALPPAKLTSIPELTSAPSSDSALQVPRKGGPGSPRPSPRTDLAHLRTPGGKCLRLLPHPRVSLNLSGLLPANQMGMTASFQPTHQLQRASG